MLKDVGRRFVALVKGGMTVYQAADYLGISRRCGWRISAGITCKYLDRDSIPPEVIAA